MPAKSILLVNDDPTLLEHLQKSINATVISTRDTSRLGRKFKHQAFPLIVLEMKKTWPRDLKRLLNNGKQPDDRYVIIGSAGLLKQTAERINDITAQVLDKHPSTTVASHAKPTPHNKPSGLALEEIMEHRLKDFIKQMKTSGGRNLHSMLLREIERPLISITLRETNGNQIQAAHLLGMNRNTLRKKIKELRIRVHKNP